MGDTHVASLEDVIRHGFSETPAFFALVAIRQSDERTLGILQASPVFSTTRGGTGLYISDLWVDSAARGEGLGRKLLASSLQLAPESWKPVFLRLAVYGDNQDARRFYERLGFEARKKETVFDLTQPALDTLRKRS
jgi:ribosomal protein S18 acetylase RimI-like enzyme